MQRLAAGRARVMQSMERPVSVFIFCCNTKNEKDIYLDLEKQKSELINLIHSGDIETIHSQEPCLEDIFINLTGEKINDK